MNSSPKGFTLIEIVLVLALLAMLGSISFVTSISFYRNRSFSDEVTSFLISLMHTRSMAINNVCLGNNCDNGKSHGVHVDHNSYTLFEGSDFSHRDTNVDQIIYFSETFRATTSADTLFTQVEGRSSPVTINLFDDLGHVAKINITSEGAIDLD